MSEIQTEPAERRTQSRDLIDKLLTERKEMFALYCEVAGLEPFPCKVSTKEKLQEFCQILMDYVAFCHFEVFYRISNGTERRTQTIEIAKEVYPRYVEATDVIVAFNDKYDNSDHELVMDNISNDLSRLGEELATQVELEDRLVATMLSR
ncbi:MAG: sigma D regulator [Candidatus Polarisedimenticolaceae bacterium]|nr:sigma D regulator [Candidatus Polarisedimenticolaceae bacterium]